MKLNILCIKGPWHLRAGHACMFATILFVYVPVFIMHNYINNHPLTEALCDD